MGIKIKVQTNTADIIAKIQAGKAAMIPAVAEQALADCNYFARRDQGTLIQSSETASDLKNGDLVWNTPYAKKSVLHWYTVSRCQSQRIKNVV